MEEDKRMQKVFANIRETDNKRIEEAYEEFYNSTNDGNVLCGAKAFKDFMLNRK